MSNGNFNGSCHYPRYSHRLPKCLASISTAHGERKINDMTVPDVAVLAVKVVDIFGNDTTVIVEITV